MQLKGIEKECISCGGKGHTYLECKKINFIDECHNAFGVVNLLKDEN